MTTADSSLDNQVTAALEHSVADALWYHVFVRVRHTALDAFITRSLDRPLRPGAVAELLRSAVRSDLS